MKYDFEFNQIGLGDIIIHISYLSDFFNPDSDITVNLSKETLNVHMTYPNEYLDFSEKLIEFLSPPNIKFDRNLKGKALDIATFFQIYSFNGKRFKFIDLREKIGSKEDNSAIILNTKAQLLDRGIFNNIKNPFFNLLNMSNKKFIIVGEREVEYGKLYNPAHSKNITYSIYPDIIQNIDADKIIDLSLPKLGVTAPNWDKLLNDLHTIKNHNVIQFGCGGSLYLYECITNVITYNVPQSATPRFVDPDCKIYFDNPQIFLKKVEEFLNKT